MPVSAGTYPCPFCLATSKDMQKPLVTRERSADRTYRGVKENYKKNGRETGWNRDLQSRYYNIIDKPKLNSAPNDMDERPIYHWLIVPFLHVVRSQYFHRKTELRHLRFTYSFKHKLHCNCNLGLNY